MHCYFDSIHFSYRIQKMLILMQKAFSEIIAKHDTYEVSGISRVTKELEPFLPELAEKDKTLIFANANM